MRLPSSQIIGCSSSCAALVSSFASVANSSIVVGLLPLGSVSVVDLKEGAGVTFSLSCGAGFAGGGAFGTCFLFRSSSGGMMCGWRDSCVGPSCVMCVGDTVCVVSSGGMMCG